MRLALLCLLLSGCWSQEARLSDCFFGAATDAQAHECAVRNFGEKAAREAANRKHLCAIVVDPAWRAVNCRTSKAEEPTSTSNSNPARKG